MKRPHYGKCLSAAVILGVALTVSPGLAADGASGAAPTSTPSTWKPGIKAQYDAIRALPGKPTEPIRGAIRKLAAEGAAARPALAALAGDASLPEPHRAYSGIMVAYLVRFDVIALRTMADSHANPFARRQAIDLLADIGGPQVKSSLGALAKKDASLTAYIDKALARAPAAESIGADDRRLLSILVLEPSDAKTRAIVILVDRYKGKTIADPWLESVLTSSVSDSETQMQAATGIVKLHNESVAALKPYTARNKHRFVRYTAIVDLSKMGPAGEQVLRDLLAAPDEPLRPQIESRLAKK